MIVTILTFIIILGLLVFVHEFGHFWVAKKSGMKVEEFGFGFPPRVVGIQKMDEKWKWVWGMKNNASPQEGKGTGDDSIYSINAIPLGGFVRILGENNEGEEDPRSFVNRPFWGRFFTLVAGVIMNLLLAWVLVSVGLMFNLPSQIDSMSNPPKHAVVQNPQIAIQGVAVGAPAAKAGLLPNDILLSMDGKSVTDASAAIPYIRSHASQPITFEIKRISENKTITITPEPKSDLQGQGYIGAEMANIATVRYPWYFAFWEGAKGVVYQVWAMAVGLFGLITGHISLSNVGGPVQIAKLTGQARQLGLLTLMQFTAFLSINLAVLNILPFPALDGGRVLFLLIEKIRGKRNNRSLEQAVNAFGFMALLLLMVVVTIKDIIHK